MPTSRGRLARAFAAPAAPLSNFRSAAALGRDAQATFFVVAAGLLAFSLLAGVVAAPARPDDQPAPASAPVGTSRTVRFLAVDVTLDPKGTPLAAYQLQFDADPQRVTLVGIEGGDHAAFKQPPYYDPAALNQNRVVLAAFNTGSDLPSQSFRAARLHLQVTEGEGRPRWRSKLIVATTADGAPVDATVVTRSSEGAEQ